MQNNKKTIKNKFFLSVYLIVLMTTFFVDTIVYFIYKNDIENKIGDYGQQAIDNMAVNISKNILQMEENITYKINDTALFYPNKVKDGLVNSNVEIKAFVALVGSNDIDVKTCYVERTDGTIAFWSGGNETYEAYKTLMVWKGIDEIKNLSTQNRGTMLWRRFSDRPNSIFLIKNVIDVDSLQKQAFLCLEIDDKYFETLCKSDFMPFIVRDEHDVILYATDSIKDPADNKAVQKKYITMDALISKKGWNLTGLVERNESLANLNHLLTIITLFEIILLFISVVIASKVADNITTNIRTLIAGMKRLENGEDVEEIKPISGDETEYLVQTFNDLNQRLKDTVAEVTEKQVQKEKAEYHALVTQLNPHFLYNTLESMSAMAKLNGQQEIVDSISALSKILRVSLTDTDGTVSLRSEIDYINQYLKLEKLVTGGKVDWEIDCDDNTLMMEVPKLILQPIVENSMVHGFKDKKEDAMIVIHAELQDKLIIEVSDNGCGMTVSEVDGLLNREIETVNPSEDRKHIGIGSIKKRLRYMYGEDAGISIDSTPEIGTTIKIEIPYPGETNV